MKNSLQPTTTVQGTTANATLLRSTAALVNFYSGDVEKGEVLKFTHTWTTRDGAPLQVGNPLLVLFPTGAVEGFRMLRKWQPSPIKTIVRQPGAELPDPDDLNAQIPREQWEQGLDGNPRPPWSKYFILYLLDTSTASLFTYVNCTIGCRLLVTRIEERTQWARALYGDDVLPMVKLTDRPFPTRYGERRAPELQVLGFRRFTGGGLRIVDQSAQGLEEVQLPPIKETLRDEVPF
jgi:hypothetical protein